MSVSFELEQHHSSAVTEFLPPLSKETVAHFASLLAFETDCWDVHHALTSRTQDFVLLDVRDRVAYLKSHVPGAESLPREQIDAERMASWPAGTVFVVYCAGPHCNGADKAALALARLGLPVKIMIGGIAGWALEGFHFATGALAKGQGKGAAA